VIHRIAFLLGDCRDGFSYGLNRVFQLVQPMGEGGGVGGRGGRGLPLNRHRPEGSLFPRKGASFLLDAGRLSQTIEWPPVFKQAVVLW